MWARLRSLWCNLVRRRRADRELDDELAALHALLVDEKVEAGKSSSAARRAATIELGHPHIVAQHVRDHRAGAFLDTLAQDVRYGARLLRRNPLFTMTAVLSLAICLGANAAIFTVANRLLLRTPAGVADPDRLVDISPTDGRKLIQPVVPVPGYDEIVQRVTLLDGVFGYAFNLDAFSLRAEGNAERVFGTVVTDNYFAVLGVRPAAGRLFGLEDAAAAERPPLIVLSHAFWRRRFNADAAIVGRIVMLNGRPVTICGVAAEGFNGLSLVVADVWIPLSFARAHNQPVQLLVGGRQRRDVSFGAAAAEMDAIGRSIGPTGQLPRPPVPPGAREQAGFGLRLTRASPVPALLRAPVMAFLALLVAVVFLVLAIACANIAGLLLARAAARRREIAVRVAMGAGRTRLIRQLLTETMLVFAMGGAAGLLLARLLISLLVALVPAFTIPLDLRFPMDARVFTATAGLSFAAALLSGLVPARHASRADVVAVLKSDIQGPSDRRWARNTFVVAQVAFSVLLTVATGLLGRAMQRTAFVDPGFDRTGVEVTELDLSLAGQTSSMAGTLVRQLLDRVRSLPAVDGAAAAALPPSGRMVRLCCGISVPGARPPDGQPLFQPSWNVVTPGYFATLRAPILAGRDFAPTDRRGTERVAIVSAAAVREFWPGESAVGKYVLWHTGSFLRSLAPGPARPAPDPIVRVSIVGVAGDLRSGGSQPEPVMYLPLDQEPRSQFSLLARSSNGGRLANEIRAIVASVNPNLPIINSQQLADQPGPVEFQLRVSAFVSAAVGAIGMLLAAIGIYGLTAYTVTRRTREIGVRIAVGAQRSTVVAIVLKQGMSLVVAGSAIGLFVSALASRLLTRLLFGVPPLDPVAFGGAALLLSLVGLAACVVPAVRATRIDVVDALRTE